MTTLTAGVRLPLPTWLWLGLPGVLVAALYAPLVPALVREWTAFPSLSHGFAIPLIAGYLVWTRRDRIQVTSRAPALEGLPVLLAGLAALTAGVHGQESFIARLSLPVTLVGLVVSLAGWRMLRETWIGIAYLVFMIPPPWATLKLVTYRARLLDADASALALRWLGVPVLQDGVFLHLSTITLEVADACSSIPAMAALTSLGFAYASLTSRPLPIRLVLVLAAIPAAIVANIIRITTTAAGVYYLGVWTLGSIYHSFNGTVNFLLTFLLLILLDGGLLALTRWRR